MRRSWTLWMAGLWACGWLLACGGLGPTTLERQDARAHFAQQLGAGLPKSATQVRVVQGGVDPVNNGEARLPAAAAKKWFEDLTLPCDGELDSQTGTPEYYHHLPIAPAWRSPKVASVSQKRCFGSRKMVSVGLVPDGKNSWVWLTVAWL